MRFALVLPSAYIRMLGRGQNEPSSTVGGRLEWSGVRLVLKVKGLEQSGGGGGDRLEWGSFTAPLVCSAL